MSLENYGDYQLIKKLASGGMASIFLARQKGLEGFEKLLVVKRILPHLAENEEFIKMFLDEAKETRTQNARQWENVRALTDEMRKSTAATQETQRDIKELIGELKKRKP